MPARKAIIAGALAAKLDNGGHAWSRLSLAGGLRGLGFEVVYAEVLADATARQRHYFDSLLRQFDIPSCLLAKASDLREAAAGATLLVNVGGHIEDPEARSRIPVSVYLDDDPGYTQLWHEAGLLGDRLAGHDAYFTFGANLGRPECPLPTNGIDWRPLEPPVVLADWPVATAKAGRFTTVASWRGAYGRVRSNGHLYGQKAHEFRRFAELPHRAPFEFEIALDIDPADCRDEDLLRRHGWQLVHPVAVAGSPDEFRRYVQSSSAEFSAAQGIYVETRCGWFSDRTTRYLASGKPALVQDTGFSTRLPTGDGLVAFTTLEEAAAGAESIVLDYERHSRAAREIAAEYFDSDLVVRRMLEAVGL